MASCRILLNILSHFTHYWGGLGRLCPTRRRVLDLEFLIRAEGGKQSPNDQDLVQGSWTVGSGGESDMPIVAELLGCRR